MAHRRIDVHQHAVPPAHTEWLRGMGIRDAGGRELPAWSAEARSASWTSGRSRGNAEALFPRFGAKERQG
jgi:hypothetical protein